MTKQSLSAETVEKFWHERAQKCEDLVFEEIANFEGDPERLKLRMKLESDVIFGKLNFSPEKRVLDLGAGCGQYAMRFAPLVKEVVAVERDGIFCQIGRDEATRRGLNNVHFVTRPAEEYIDEKNFDILFISGLFIYLPDHHMEQIARHLEKMKAPGSVLFIREPVSLLGEDYPIHKYSPKLETTYSALYRDSRKIINLFQNSGWMLSEEGWFFEDGSILNVHAETRLRYFLFAAN